MANLTMINWRIEDKLPYINLGSAGENNASIVTITVDALIENANYYLDIGDESGSGLPNTQELTPSSNEGTNDETIYTLSMQPMVTWLGKEGVKLLQVRCVYTEDDKQIVKESNVFHAKVDRNSGFVYKYDIAVFEEYLDKIKESGGSGGDYVTEDELIEALRPYATETEVDNAISNKQDKYNNIYKNVPMHYIALNNAISNTFNKPNSYLVYDQLNNVFLLTVERRVRTSENQSIILKIIALSDRTHNINLKFYYQPITSSENPQPLYLYVNGYVRAIQLSGEFANISFGDYEDYLPTSEYEWEQYNPVTFMNQVIEMPTANILTLGNIYQYVGDTDENYTNGLFYECVSDEYATPTTYSWVVKDINNLPIRNGEGTNSVIIGDFEHNIATGVGAFSVGSYTKARGSYSHSEGVNTVASQYASHAEGQSTTASGNNSHAEGNNTQANGQSSHSEGTSTYASGQNSHAQNLGTISKGMNQTAVGKYNVEQGSNSSIVDTDYALIIGNGADNSNRSNALAVQWDGTIVMQDNSTIKSAKTVYEVMSKISAKNFIPTPYYDGTHKELNGIIYDINNNGSITIDNTSSAYTYYIIGRKENLIPHGKYILSCNASDLPSGNINISIGVTNISTSTFTAKATINRNTNNIPFEIDNTWDGNYIEIRLTINSGVSVDDVIIYPMVSLSDDQDLTWQPYAMTNKVLTDKINSIKTIAVNAVDFADFQTQIASL